MSLSAKREALARIHGRYQRAGRPHKSRILEEFCATCGYHRKAALRLLNRPLPAAQPRRSGPKVRYDPQAVLPVLKALWLASDQLCSKLLKAALPELSDSVIPKGTYKQQTEDHKTVGVFNFGIAHKDLPEDLAYAITKTSLESADSKPPPRQWPWMRAMTGLGRVRICRCRSSTFRRGTPSSPM